MSDFAFEDWKGYGLFPRAYKPWFEGQYQAVSIELRADGKWLAVARGSNGKRLHLSRGAKDKATADAIIAKLAR